MLICPVEGFNFTGVTQKRRRGGRKDEIDSSLSHLFSLSHLPARQVRDANQKTGGLDSNFDTITSINSCGFLFFHPTAFISGDP